MQDERVVEEDKKRLQEEEKDEGTNTYKKSSYRYIKKWIYRNEFTKLKNHKDAF